MYTKDISMWLYIYYHTDHLGSATLITDDAADVVQQIAYLPYGEDWVDVRSNGYFGLVCRLCGTVAYRLDTIAIIIYDKSTKETILKTSDK